MLIITLRVRHWFLAQPDLWWCPRWLRLYPLSRASSSVCASALWSDPPEGRVASPASEHNKPVSPRYFTACSGVCVSLSVTHYPVSPCSVHRRVRDQWTSLWDVLLALLVLLFGQLQRKRDSSISQHAGGTTGKQHAKLHTVYKLDQEC